MSFKLRHAVLFSKLYKFICHSNLPLGFFPAGNMAKAYLLPIAILYENYILRKLHTLLITLYPLTYILTAGFSLHFYRSRRFPCTVI